MALYDVVIQVEDGWATDLVTGSRKCAVTRAKRIASAYPWQRQRVVRVLALDGEYVDFNEECQ